MKKVLGLDLGTTSIGWALVNQAETDNEESSIIRAGVRVNPLTVDELGSFEKGKAITTNADRTLKRGARRNLQRYKMRRDNLVSIMREAGWIRNDTILSEEGKNTTYETLALRAKAVNEEISLSEFARVLLMINKKRGYKSSRKAVGEDEGHIIDGMAVAKQLQEEGITPAALCLRILDSGRKALPEFYRSDLNDELDRVWSEQVKYYPDILTDDFKEQIRGKSRTNVNKIFYAKYGISTADNKGKERKRQAFQWRMDALKGKLDDEVMAYVITDICGDIANSSGYLGAIGDRSKELYFQNKTVGQYLYGKLLEDPSYSTKNQVFYRNDYLDEFERIWDTQHQFHKELSELLHKEIRDVIIFYQRRLKSQKGLINFCEFERREVNVTEDGKNKTKLRGCKTAPRSSLVFQEFKIWQILNNVEVKGPGIEGSRRLEPEEMEFLANELSTKDKLSSSDALKLLFGKSKGYSLNYKTLEGNNTLAALYRSFLAIVDQSGHGEYSLENLGTNEARQIISEVFSALGFRTDFLMFDSSLPKEEFEQQPLFKLWHLLYSYEGDNSRTGDESLIEKIGAICGTPSEYSRIISATTFKDDYASLSHKAIRKILPFLKEGNTYDVACAYAGYRHSKSSLTKEEIENKPLVDKLSILPKNNLRNPVVEKILNQMINVVNAVADKYGKPDEIHIELARELKQNAKQREKASQDIAANTKANEEIAKLLKEEFGLSFVRKSDIVRYRLYEELKPRGYKTLYSNQYVPREILFSRNIDIEHIIPQALLFDDSFSNKTIEFRDVNIEKGRQTARDYVTDKYGAEGYADYVLRVEDLFKNGAIGKAKREKLLMKQSEIPTDFLQRDLTCSQYIAKVSKEMLESYVKVVVPTNGAVTARLREDWQLVDVMKELNLPKYEKAGKTFYTPTEEGNQIKRIEDWTKRNDHRHHAMDALTIAFTRPSHIQYLNNLSARSEKSSSFYGIENKETEYVENYGRVMRPPMPAQKLRAEFKKELESVLVSIKAKNKVVTRNVNTTQVKGGKMRKVELTPRGPLHKEQVYGKRTVFEEVEVPVNGKITEEIIATVVSKEYRNALKSRLSAFDGDSKKAFAGKNSLEKNPIWLDEAHTQSIPAKVRCRKPKTVFSIRKSIDPSLSIDKVMDPRIRQLLQERLAEFGGNQAKAFSNLDENPIYLDKERGICIKRVTIAENYDLVALRDKKDKEGHLVLDKEGRTIPTDYVNLRNNHHIAIFQDSEGNLQEVVVPFFDALNRINEGRPVVDREYKKDEGWKFLFTMKSNEMFVFPNPETDFFPEDIDLTDKENYSRISPNLYRVQKFSSLYYVFRHHLETELNDDKALQEVTWKRITALNKLKGVVKVRINHIGEIVQVGEYD